MEAGALVRAVTPETIAAKIAQGRREIRAAFAAEDFELARFLIRRNAGYRLFFAPRILRRRPPPPVLGLAALGSNHALVTGRAHADKFTQSAQA